jgi:hypothetical protein
VSIILNLYYINFFDLLFIYFKHYLLKFIKTIKNTEYKYRIFLKIYWIIYKYINFYKIKNLNEF